MAGRTAAEYQNHLDYQQAPPHRSRLPQEDEVMGDVMLFGVLEMPPELWHEDSSIDRAQRHSRYKQAAQRIRADEENLAAKDAKIAELRKCIADLRAVCRESAGKILEHRLAAQKAESERDESRRLLGELLAVIHRDGGQYQAEHGAAKAAEDAMSKLSSLWCELYDLRGEYEETAALFGAWKQRAEQAESERDEARGSLKRSEADLLAVIEDRDEARECVKRLYRALAAFEDCAGYDVKGQDLEGVASEEYAAMRAALAATPEHLRNA